MMLGGHCLRHWSSTQSTLALSSGEAELHGIANGGANGLGIRSVGKDLGLNYSLTVLSDATAAIGIVRRRGLGKIRHLDCTDLWIQEKIRAQDIDVQKIPGADNLADALTKILPRPLLAKIMSRMNMMVEEGRAESAPRLTS